MPSRDIIVIGASAGGLGAVRTVTNRLPKKLPAAIFVVIHTSPDGPGLLADILSRGGNIGVTSATDGAPIRHGCVYVAPPDAHLVLTPGYIRLNRGPREHRFRPAIDPLFRSAAEHYGTRVVGIVLSGNMADGSHGLMVIKHSGGVAIVQDPVEASVPMMPLNAMNRVQVDYVLPTQEIGDVIQRLVMDSREQPRTDRPRGRKTTEAMATPEHPKATQVDAIERAEILNGPPSPFTCPECGGSLWELEDGDLVRYRCHVGHGFTADSLAVGQNGKVEEALWSALRAIEESIELRKRMAERVRQRNLTAIAPGLQRDIDDYEARAAALRDLLLQIPKQPAGRTRARARRHGNKKKITSRKKT